MASYRGGRARAGGPPRQNSRQQQPASGSDSGAVDETDFLAGFDDAPSIDATCHQMVDDIRRINETLANRNSDWSKRVDTLRRLRGYVSGGYQSTHTDEFFYELRQMDTSLRATVEDLRSQVVREACVTIAYMAKEFASVAPGTRGGLPRFDHLGTAVMPALFNLLQRSAKVMATSATIASKYILHYTHSRNLAMALTAPLVDTKSRENKSAPIRRHCCEMLTMILGEWNRKEFGSDDNVHQLQTALRRGMEDADAEARAFAREAFYAFHEQFPKEGEELLNQLDVSKRRMLEGNLSRSSSQSSLKSANATVAQSLTGTL